MRTGNGPEGHTLVYVDDDALHDTDWAFVEVDGLLVFVVKRNRWSPQLMAEAWAEYAEL